MNVTILGRSHFNVFNNPKRTFMPIFTDSVSAGFPSPAQDHIEQTLDLNELCITRPAATYFVRVQGDSMIDAGIYPNDILVVDRSLKAEHEDIVIACFDGELTVKKLLITPVLTLMPCNKQYPPISIPEGAELEIFGVVSNIVRNMRRSSRHGH